MLETNEINEVQRPTTETNQHLSCDELIERYA